jgi:hypothetical protein
MGGARVPFAISLEAVMLRIGHRGALLAVTALAVISASPGSAGGVRPFDQTVGNFSYGEMQAQTVGNAGCGTNIAGEPSIHVSRDNLVGLGSEDGLGGGSEYWRANQLGGSGTATGCDLTYAGQPNADGGIGASGGDIDTAFAPVKSASGTYRIYVASLNLGSVSVATSTDNGATFSVTPVQAGVPVDDREWIAASGADTSLLTYHDVATNDIDVLRSTDGGATYTQVSQVIPIADYKATNNELGNVVIDHDNAAPGGSFWAYQSFVAPSTDPGGTGDATYNEAFLGVSSDGGSTWTDKPIPCTTDFGDNGLGHNFPNVSVAPNGRLYYAVSNDQAVYVATSKDHGDTWKCSSTVSKVGRAIFPWLVATSHGQDLVYYGSNGSGASQTWRVYFAQHRKGSLSTWHTMRLMPVHKGDVCEGGISCAGGRQLLDDFGVDTDQDGWAHIAYSHDAPDLGGTGTYTGYAVQQSGRQAGVPN